MTCVLIRALVAIICLASLGALAQAYPTKPVRLIVPFAPGGGTDVLARMIAQQLTDALGQSVIVDNRAAIDGIVGSEILAKSAPDGYTLLLVQAAHAANARPVRY